MRFAQTINVHQISDFWGIGVGRKHLSRKGAM